MSAALAGAAVGLSVSLSLAADDEAAHERGRELFSRCERCHELDPMRGNRIGPNLYNVVGRPAAAQQDFRYSQGMRDAASGGLEWTPEQLDRFIADPRSVVRRTSMSFRGIDDPGQRSDIIAFLSTVGPQDLAAHQGPSGPAGTEIGAGAMAIQGDPAYGEYLASECVTCHQRSGTDEGIPGIVGWPREDFIRALFEYKTNVRSHPVMQMITSNLGDEEVAALAAYFNRLGAN
ncbi:MAG: c-type cytochrome [Rhodobiaceae bacterium]|nr:c-type cytochrome [Rhodobiaceae bacterium]MCC0053871.1 c-type cytochrome [Rhodobiaceae bacterium]